MSSRVRCYGWNDQQDTKNSQVSRWFTHIWDVVQIHLVTEATSIVSNSKDDQMDYLKFGSLVINVTCSYRNIRKRIFNECLISWLLLVTQKQPRVFSKCCQWNSFGNWLNEKSWYTKLYSWSNIHLCRWNWSLVKKEDKKEGNVSWRIKRATPFGYLERLISGEIWSVWMKGI